MTYKELSMEPREKYQLALCDELAGRGARCLPAECGTWPRVCIYRPGDRAIADGLA